MAVSSTQIRLSGLARKLVQDGLLAQEIAEKAADQATKDKSSLVSHLVNNKILDSYTLANVASQEFGIPLFDIAAMDMDLSAARLVEEKLVRRHHALPLYKRGNRLFVAVSDPTNLAALDEFKFHVGANAEAILVEPDRALYPAPGRVSAATRSV